jgi:F-type H+-transporting ATPase subunit epsilon
MAESHTSPESGSLRCVVVTPERAVMDEPADFIVLPMYDGELGVLPGRAPLIGRLGFGELRVKQGNNVQHFYLDGGFAQVRANVATVLTGKAVPVAEISVAAAEKGLEAALKPTNNPDAAFKQQSRMRAQLRLAKEAGSEAAAH